MKLVRRIKVRRVRRRTLKEIADLRLRPDGKRWEDALQTLEHLPVIEI